MRRLSRFRPYLLSVVFLPLAWISQAAGTENPAAELLIERLQGIAGLHSRFEQRTRGQQTQAGEFWLAKPDRFRVESSAPLSQTLVSDGSDLWTHDRDLAQVIVTKLDATAGDVPLLLLAGNPETIRQDYQVQHYENDGQEIYMLTPGDQDALFTGVALTFVDSLPVRISIESAMNETVHVELIDARRLTEFDDTLFQFTIPAGTDVVDDRIAPVAETVRPSDPAS